MSCSSLKRGGWRLLTMPLETARAAVEHLNGPEVWAALLAELAAELRQVERGTESRDRVADEAELDDAGVPWVPRLGGRASLGAEIEHVARTGRWNRSRHAGRSEARIGGRPSTAESGSEVRPPRLSAGLASLPDASWLQFGEFRREG